MGRKANTKIKLPLEIPADLYQRIAVRAAGENKQVIDFVIDQFTVLWGVPVVQATTTAPLPFPAVTATQPLTPPAPAVTAVSPAPNVAPAPLPVELPAAPAAPAVPSGRKATR